MYRTALLASLGLALSASLCSAADHRDGTLAASDPSADLNDVYLFINPNDASELVAIVTFHPDAPRDARFSDAVEYRMHFDNGATGGRNTITCTFPRGVDVNCSGLGGALSVQGGIDRTLSNGDLRVFTGLRDDPFFFDGPAFNRTRADLAPRFTNPGVNSFRNFNTLIIAMGIKHARLTNGGANPILKVYGSSNRIGDTGISAGHSGMWFDASNPGHGLVLQALGTGVSAPDAPRQMVAYWAVYDNAGNQLNVYGVGNIDGDSVSIPVSSDINGRFPPGSSASIQNVPFGTLDFDFTGCNSGTMRANPTRTGFAPVEIPLTRLTPVEDLPCTFFREGQIDRNGRPAVNTALINVIGPDNGLKNTYNQAEDIDSWPGLFQAEMQANLSALDTLDGVSGNALLPAATLASVLVDDRLQIDTRQAQCNQYLAVELSIAGQCGGRTLERDVIDDSLGAIVGPGVSDNVGLDDTFLPNFPFIGPPR
ncbi:DUF4331 family protein [Pseudomarimonas salicorniae]|uniref:DUF4331 domain-containing protein n=1 Tax=Pseudomarimonas salicorniae TaxID=2933270 RepID=A0ABT0GHQ7_9GAMM|nr:DUF4331 family protein [Lysobacter sp. CAU 1642]MCK7594082.1 DUF4331 domain-containing protein [Lysobacter sp. CAU 1642]